MTKRRIRVKKQATATKHLQGPFTAFLVRVPADMKTWLEDTAAQFHLSRDAFIRLQLANVREGFKVAATKGSEEQELFEAFESKLVAATERAVREAVIEAQRRPKFAPR